MNLENIPEELYVLIAEFGGIDVRISMGIPPSKVKCHPLQIVTPEQKIGFQTSGIMLMKLSPLILFVWCYRWSTDTREFLFMVKKDENWKVERMVY